MSEKIYRVQMNSKGMPNFSTAVEIADRPQGEWIEERANDADYISWHRWKCSVCGDWQTYGTPRHCPNCGARMKGADDGD